MNMFSRLHARMGDLWWYTLLLFAVQRFGDAINLFVGLWLVPKYVPQNELGAVMPLTQFVSFVGIPLAVVAIPFMKFLGEYADRGEMGKVKALLRDVFLGTGAMAILTLLLAWIAMPFVFERMRVQIGSLGILIVGVSILGAVSNIFQNAVQGLKLFQATIWFGVLSAPLRLVLMLVTMPFRALSGYFVGQSAGPSVMVLGSLWALRGRLGASVKAQPYIREDWRRIWRYTWPIALYMAFSTLFLSVDQLIIRHRLSEFDSAGYYVISRFADIANYLGGTLVLFLFPLVANPSLGDGDARRVLRQSAFGSLIGGLAIALALLAGGHWLLGLSGQWRVYQKCAFEMFVLACCNAVSVTNACFITHEIARGRFRFLCFFLPILSFKMVFSYALTGYTFFTGFVPQSWIDAVASFNPNRLGVVLGLFLAFQILLLASLLFGGALRSSGTGRGDGTAREGGGL